MAQYFMRADGTAANKAAATGPTSDASACMNVTVHNGETFSAGDEIVVSDAGGVYRATLIPPSSGSSGSPVAYSLDGSPVLSGMDVKTGFTEAASGDVLLDSQTNHSFNFFNFGRDASNYWRVVEWDATENCTIPTIKAWLAEVGTIAAGKKVWFEIYDDSGGSPNAMITNGQSNMQEAADVSTSGELITFTFATPPSLTSGATYYFVVKFDWTTSTSNYMQWRGINSDSDAAFNSGRIYSNSTWDDAGVDGGHIEIYKAGTSGTLWEAAVTTEPHVVFMDGTYGIRRETTNTLAAEYEWHWASNVLTVYAATDPDTRYTSPGVEIAARVYNIDINGKSWLSFDGLRIEGCNKYGIYMRGDESGNHTFANMELHASAQFGVVTAAADWVRNVSFTDCASTYCGSTGFKVNLRTDGWTLTRCTSDHDACIDYVFDDGDGEQQWGAGIKLDAANNTDFCINHVIDDCTVTNAGKKRDGVDVVTTGDQKGFGIWLDWLRCSVAGNGTEVKNSFAHSNLLSGFFCEKTNHSVWSNLYSVLNGEYGFRMDADDDDIVDDNTVSHVTLHGNDVNLFMAGGWAQDGTHFVDNTFRNIICSDAVTYEVVGKWGAENDGTRGSGNTYEYILIATEGTSFIEWRNSGASQIFYDTVAAWETAETGVANNDVGDPLFANEGGTTRAAYKLTAGSPALAAGVDVGLLTDAFGNPWLVPPDIGAHSYSGEHSGTRTPSGIAGNLGINLAVRIGL